MVAWLGDYYRLVAIHRPLGIMILILCRHSVCKTDVHDAAAVPTHHVPSGTIPGFVIREVALGLMFAQPLVAWGMLSAGQLSHCDVRASAFTANSAGNPTL
jgi:cytochrome b561